MIVRDEAEVIERCLDSVDGLIDAWTICDTGSEDETPELIEAKLAGLPGTLHRRPWKDFGHNRSELMELARGTADYLLLVDADMTVARHGELPELTADAYELRHAGDLGYWIPRLVRGDLAWHFVGATHEYLALDRDHTQERLEALEIEHHADGGTRDEKFQRDRALLESALETDPEDERSTFYLAQTLRDMGEVAAAIELYRRRVELGGWEEEVFYASLQIAELTAQESPREAIPLFLEAFERRPIRAEPMHQAANACRRLGWMNSAYAFAKQAAEIPQPDDSLFVAAGTYSWGALFELGFAAHAIGRRDEAIEAYRALLDGRELPASIGGSVRENLRRIANIAGGTDLADRSSTPSLSELVPSVRLGEISLEVEPAWPQFNPSIASDGDGFRAIVRTANYRVHRGSYSTIDGSSEIRTVNYMAWLDSELNLVDVKPLADQETSELEWHDFEIRGWEDCRLFEIEGEWYATATSRELAPEGVCRQVLLTLDGPRIAAARVLPGPDPHRHEKNWMPYVTGGELLFVYSCSPSLVLRVDPAEGDPVVLAHHDAPEEAMGFRGGSQGVAVPGGTLFCIHEALDYGGPRRYLHRWVCFDESWRLSGVSPRFHFADHDVEICAGLTRRGNELIASFGVDDRAAALAVMDQSEVLGTLEEASALATESEVGYAEMHGI